VLEPDTLNQAHSQSLAVFILGFPKRPQQVQGK
jgi:hypothetical protein